MSNMTHGMTVDQVEDLGRLLQARADQMRQLVSEVESALGGTSWIGPDADAFRHRWWPDHRHRDAGGTFRSWKGQAVTFAAFPG